MSAAPSPRYSKRAESEISSVGDSTLIRVRGMLDEHFPGFGDLAGARVIVIDLAGVRFITSFGVRQWLRTMSALPQTARVYLTNCPVIFVEQLNMILNFGGRAQILTLLAPYRCSVCGAESEEVIDAVAHGAAITGGALPVLACKKCNGPLNLDEMPEIYFSCLTKYGPRDVDTAAVQQLLQADPQSLPKQVIKPKAPVATPAAAAAAATPAAEKSSVVWWVVIGLVLAGIATGLYFLVGPS